MEEQRFWKALNFACSRKGHAREEGKVLAEERSKLVQLLLNQPDAIPGNRRALAYCHDKIQSNFPFVLPQFLRVVDEAIHHDAYAAAKRLYQEVCDKTSSVFALMLCLTYHFGCCCSFWTYATLRRVHPH